MPFIPFAGTVGAAMGAGAATSTAAAWVGGTTIAAAGAAVGTSSYSAMSQATSAKKAASAMTNQTNAEIANLQKAQAAASTSAQESLKSRQRARAMNSQTIFTSPLGVADQAATVKKTLLGS